MAQRWRTPSLFLVSLFFVFSSTASSQTGPTKNILVLFFNSQSLPANIAAFHQLHEVLEGLPDLDNQLFAEYVDDYRLKNGINTVAKSIQEKYRGHRFDLIITVGGAPLDLAIRYGPSLFPGVPVVFLRIEQRLLPEKLPANFTGVVVKVDFAGTVNLALRLHPTTQHMFYISGSSPMEQFFRSAAEKELAGVTSADITYLQGLRLDDLLQRVGSLPKDSVVIYQEMLQDSAGRSYVSTNVSALVAAAANAPVYGLYKMHFASGIVGGVLTDPATNARQGARLALRVLRGEPPSKLPIQQLPSDPPMLDWRQLQRWHIPEKLAPAGSVVEFRELTVWERYHWGIVGGILLVLAQALLIIGLLRQRSKKKKVEASLMERLRFETFVSELSTTLANAPEEEVDKKIQGSLAQIGEILGVERITIRELSADQAEFRATLAWHSLGTLSTSAGIRVDQYPLLAGRVLRGEFVSIPDVNSLPDEAGAEKEYFLQSGARAVASVPLAAGTQTFGGITFVSTRFRVLWTDDLVKQLKMLAELFSSTLSRKRTVRALRASVAELRELGGRLITAEEQERNRLALELHDDLGQRMALLNIGASHIETALAPVAPRYAELLREHTEHISEVSTAIHNLSYHLHPTKLDIVGLVPTLRGLCRQFSEQHRLQVQFVCDEFPDDLPKEIALCLYRISQESLNNVVKHSGATEAKIELSSQGDTIELCISDSGKGFEVDAAKRREGLGLTNMQERLRPLGGQLAIASGASQGTRITVQVPFLPGPGNEPKPEFSTQG